MSDSTSDDSETPLTANKEYAERLVDLREKRWKRILNVQAPFRAHIRSLKLGRTLDVGCGTGRNLAYLDPSSVGVDHNPFSIQVAKDAGLEAYTTDEFLANPAVSAPQSYDSMLAAHVVEHLERDAAREIFASYLGMIKPGGRVVLITPQERGYASDATHVVFADFAELSSLTGSLGLTPVKQYSFPFPRFTGRFFTYNEFVSVTRVPG